MGPGGAAAPPAPPADPEVVIRQARARQRRRRRRVAVTAAAAAAGAIVYLAGGHTGGTRLVQRRASGRAGLAPTVNLAAFAGHGELAFVSRGRLWVADGATRTLRRVATPGMTPSGPVFSRDGGWLAFLATRVSPAAGTASYAVWLAAGDGSGAHQVQGPGGVAGFPPAISWSPAADVLAVSDENTVRLISPSGKARTLARTPGIASAAWSPDGGSLAVASTRWPSATTLASYPVAGGKPTVWLRLNARHGVLNGMRQIVIDLAGWWPDQGIGFWVFGDGMEHNNDQTPLNLITAPGTRPRLLGYTLSDTTTTDAVAASRTGWLALVNNSAQAFGRLIWQGKHVRVCAPAASCTTVPFPPGTVTIDPAWSPDGATLAFVQAPASARPGFPQPIVARWYDAHQLWLYRPATRSLRRLDAPGASDPAWSADGRSLLYTGRDGIWLLPRLSGRPARITTPLFQPGNWPAYYGQVGWMGQFAWWPG